MKREVPRFESDEQAAEFLEQDLSDLDFSQFKPVTFDFGTDNARLALNISRRLLQALENRAAAEGVPIEGYVRALIERDMRSSRR